MKKTKDDERIEADAKPLVTTARQKFVRARETGKKEVVVFICPAIIRPREGIIGGLIDKIFGYKTVLVSTDTHEKAIELFAESGVKIRRVKATGRCFRVIADIEPRTKKF